MESLLKKSYIHYTFILKKVTKNSSLKNIIFFRNLLENSFVF